MDSIPQSNAAILSRFPGPVTLKPRPMKWLFVLTVAIGFVVIGVFLIYTSNLFWGCVNVIFFTTCAVVAIFQLIPGMAGMTFDSTGFEIHGLRHWRSLWPDVDNFSIYQVRASKLVVYDDRTRSKNTMATLSRTLSGRGAGLPDTYGLRPDELALLMTLWRDHALQRSQVSR